MSTRIMPCTCKDPFQDDMYGKGMRVHNVSHKTKNLLAYCTVCSPSRARTLRGIPTVPIQQLAVFGVKPNAYPTNKDGNAISPQPGAKAIAA